MKGAGGVAAIIAVPFVFVFAIVMMLVMAGSSASASGCGGTAAAVNITQITPTTTIAGYGAEQLINAAAVMNAATALQLDAHAQEIGVMTAMGESGLRNINYGDGAINPDGTVADSIGLFQQQHGWGSAADRMNPATAATFFFQRMIAVPNWEQLAPSALAHAVQINADPNFYTQFYPAAVQVVQGLTGGAAAGNGCAVSGDAVALAQQLTTAADQGKFTGATPDHIKEIRWIAAGQTVPNCGVDVRILQVLVFALNKFGSIGVSDINRLCTGQIEGAGTASSHYVDGGGHAVDFIMLGGKGLDGSDSQSLQLIQALDPIMPKGAHVGQAECRAAAGDTPTLTNLVAFDDTCSHLHIDVGGTDGKLNFTAAPPK